MKNIPDKEKKIIIKTLKEKGATLSCPGCDDYSFTLLDGYFNQIIQKKGNSVRLEGYALPSVVVVCDNCGYMRQHALGALGLMEDIPDSSCKEDSLIPHDLVWRGRLRE